MKISEKQIEDWICEHPEQVIWDSVKIIGRQVPVKHGQIDLLAWDGRTIVIELKARLIAEKDIGQLLRYVYDVSSELRRIGFNEQRFLPWQEPPPSKLTDKFYDVSWFEYTWQTGTEPTLIPILIGTDISEKVLAAATAADIVVILWTQDEDGVFEFSHKSPYDDSLDLPQDHPYPDWLLSLVDNIKQSCEQDADECLERLITNLMEISLTN